MDNWNYRRIADPNGEQLYEVTTGLNAFGMEQVGGEGPARIAVLCETPDDTVMGGAIGHSIRHRFYLTQLWVTEALRCQGIGTELVSRMESIARERDCRDVVVDTLNRDAATFYRKLGYHAYVIIPDYIQGFDWHFLSKVIDGPSALYASNPNQQSVTTMLGSE
jgi:ribosomal protein S18 acetylase RimI-like enzyme